MYPDFPSFFCVSQHNIQYTYPMCIYIYIFITLYQGKTYIFYITHPTLKSQSQIRSYELTRISHLLKQVRNSQQVELIRLDCTSKFAVF